MADLKLWNSYDINSNNVENWDYVLVSDWSNSDKVERRSAPAFQWPQWPTWPQGVPWAWGWIFAWLLYWDSITNRMASYNTDFMWGWFELADASKMWDPMFSQQRGLYVFLEDWIAWETKNLQQTWSFSNIPFYWTKYVWSNAYVQWPLYLAETELITNVWTNHLNWAQNKAYWQTITIWSQDIDINFLLLPNQLNNSNNFSLKIYTDIARTTEITSNFLCVSQAWTNAFWQENLITLSANTQYYFEFTTPDAELWLYASWTTDNSYTWWAFYVSDMIEWVPQTAIEQTDKDLWFVLWIWKKELWYLWQEPYNYNNPIIWGLIVTEDVILVWDYSKADKDNVYLKTETLTKNEIQTFPYAIRIPYFEWYSTWDVVRLDTNNQIVSKVTWLDELEAGRRIITSVNSTESYILAPLLSDWVSISKYISWTTEIWDPIYINDSWSISLTPWTNEIIIGRVTWKETTYMQYFETVDPLLILWTTWNKELTWDNFIAPDTLENLMVWYKNEDWKMYLADASDVNKINNLKVSLEKTNSWNIWNFSDSWVLEIPWVTNWVDYYLQNAFVNTLEQPITNSTYTIWWEKKYIWQSILVNSEDIKEIEFDMYQNWTTDYVIWLRVFKDKTRNTVLFTSPTTYITNDLTSKYHSFDLEWLPSNIWDVLYFELYVVSWTTTWDVWARVRIKSSNPYPDGWLYYTNDDTWEVTVSTYWDAKFRLTYVDYGRIRPAATIYTMEWAEYEDKSFSIAWEWTGFTDIDIPWDDWVDMYALSRDSDAIFQYILSDPNNIESAIYTTKTFDLNASIPWELDIRWIKLNKAKDKLYVVWRSTFRIYQFSLSTPWDITTATSDGVSLLVSSEENLPDSIAFNDEETYLYLVWYWTDTIHQYVFNSTDISLSSYDNKEFLVPDSSPQWIRLSKDWKHVFILWTTNNKIFQLDLWVKDDISTAVNNWIFYTLSFPLSSQPWWITFNNNWTRMFLIAWGWDDIYQIKTWVWELVDNEVLIWTWIDTNILELKLWIWEVITRNNASWVSTWVFNISNIPTSSTWLNSWDVWSDAWTLKIIP